MASADVSNSSTLLSQSSMDKVTEVFSLPRRSAMHAEMKKIYINLFIIIIFKN